MGREEDVALPPGRVLDIAFLLEQPGVVQAEHAGLAFALAPEMEQGGLGAVLAEARFAPLFLIYWFPVRPKGAHGEFGHREAGGLLRAVGGGVFAANAPGPLTALFTGLDEVFDAVGEGFARALAGLVARGGLAACEADAFVQQLLPAFLLVVQVFAAVDGQVALAWAVGKPEGRFTTPGATALLE